MEETKICPYCGETILKVARKCKWCGEWLDENVQPQTMSCPVCGELIAADSETCPLCNEPIKVEVHNKQKQIRSKYKFRPVHIIIAVAAVVAVVIGGMAVKSYILEQEYNESLENSPYSVISKNLDEAISEGQTLAQFLREEKNVKALKQHFGEEQYALILKLGETSATPLTSCDPIDNYAGGYAWRSASEKNRTGCRLVCGRDKLACQFWYDGVEVSQFGYIVRNKHWTCDYYKDNFNEDDKSKPYIEQRWTTKEDDDSYFCIRLDNEWGVSIRLYTFSGLKYFNELLLRNNDTDEIWTLPINVIGSGEAVLEREGWQKFYTWMQTASSLKLSARDSEGNYNPFTTVLYNEETKLHSTFQDHVMKKEIDRSIFEKHTLE